MPLLRDLELGAIQAHILYHAANESFYGLWMVKELARHGYLVSYGTLYPTLHRMEQAGLLVHEDRRRGSTMRKYYHGTAEGLAALREATRIIGELYLELIQETNATGPRGAT